jgi:urease accessory protein
MLKKLILAGAALAAGAAPAFAHLDPVEHGSFLAGLSHPLSGADHIVAMVAVGLWATLGAGRAVWQLPATFVGAMILGFAAALAGLGLPFVEPVILASAVVLGLLVAIAAPVPILAGLALVGFFAFFHGHAHGGAIGEAGVATYAFGFIAATAILHIIGIGIARPFGGNHGLFVTRMAVATASVAGVTLVAVEVMS